LPISRRVNTEKDGFVTATKLGTTNKIFVAATKNLAAATKRFVNRTKPFAVVTKCFCYPYFITNDFVSITKPFFPMKEVENPTLKAESGILSPSNDNILLSVSALRLRTRNSFLFIGLGPSGGPSIIDSC